MPSGSRRLREANKSEAAEFFDVAPKTIDSWVRRGAPVLHRGQGRLDPWKFDLLDVARWKFSGVSEGGEIDPDQLQPSERKAWFESENKRRDLQVRDRELIPASEVEQAVATAFAAISQGLRSLPDNIERRLGIAPEVTEAIESVLDDEMQALADRLESLAPTDFEQDDAA